jgi:type I restriction enzyme, S subunit
MHVPEGWRYSTIEDYIDLLSGFAFKSDCYSNDSNDILLLRGDNIEPGSLRWRDAKRWSRHQCNYLDKYYLRAGDFVIAMDRTWISSGLKVAEVKVSDLPCILVQRVSRIRTKSSFVQGLLKQIFSTHRFEQYVKGVQTETAVPHISAKQIKEFPVLIPPLPEQQKIAQILSTWDKAIEKLECLFTAKIKRKKALMQQLLTGKKRFVGFEGEWRKIELGKLLDYKQPTSFLVKSTKYSDEYPTPVLTAGKTFVLGRTNEDFGIYQEDLPVIIFDDFTTASKFVDFSFKAKSSAMKILTAKKGVSIKYIFEAMQILNHPIGGHQRHWISIYSNLIISLPKLEEQQKIAAILSAADKEIENHQKQLSTLKEQKKGLMQQLLTGKKRVKIDESEKMAAVKA